MSINGADAVLDKQISLLDELQNLLEKKLELAQRGDISGVEALSKQADTVVEKIAKMGIPERADFENQRENLKKLYEQLSLAISAQKAETSKQLSGIRKGRKTLHVYREGI